MNNFKKLFESFLIEEKTVRIPDDVFTASLGPGPQKWKKWYMANGFTHDKSSNLLKKDGKLWRVNQKNKSLEVAKDKK